MTLAEAAGPGTAGRFRQSRKDAPAGYRTLARLPRGRIARGARRKAAVAALDRARGRGHWAIAFPDDLLAQCALFTRRLFPSCSTTATFEGVLPGA